ncbi:hypothetical protein JXA48_04500 [Candidatus Woesearchaeota archaeon]|nr:hypothetical protein [Candidatus Woesearchaeota archaeon]
MSLESKITMSSFIKYATFVDIFDAISGPLSLALYSSGSDYLYSVANVLNFVELGIVKAPFIFSYLSKTKDFGALLYWAPKELVSNFIPLCSLIDVVPAYHARIKYEEGR